MPFAILANPLFQAFAALVFFELVLWFVREAPKRLRRRDPFTWGADGVAFVPPSASADGTTWTTRSQFPTGCSPDVGGSTSPSFWAEKRRT